MAKLIRNAVRCKNCSTVLESKHRHDFQSCKCGVFTDGGLAYQRAGWPAGDRDKWIEDLCEWEDNT